MLRWRPGKQKLRVDAGDEDSPALENKIQSGDRNPVELALKGRWSWKPNNWTIKLKEKTDLEAEWTKPKKNYQDSKIKWAGSRPIEREPEKLIFKKNVQNKHTGNVGNCRKNPNLWITSVDEGEECRNNGHNRSAETTALTRPAQDEADKSPALRREIDIKSCP